MSDCYINMMIKQLRSHQDLDGDGFFYRSSLRVMCVRMYDILFHDWLLYQYGDAISSIILHHELDARGRDLPCRPVALRDAFAILLCT